MKVFIDNDVVIKLAEYELLLPFLDIIESNGHNICVLEALYFVAGLHRKHSQSQRFSSLEIEDTVRTFWERVSVAEISFSETFNLINSVDDPNLDPGELVLIGCAHESEESGLCSGDKRAIEATNNCVEVNIFSLSNCEVVSLEIALKILLHCYCPATVIHKVQQKQTVDSALRLCFRNASVDELGALVCAIDSYVNHLTSKCPSLTFFEI